MRRLVHWHCPECGQNLELDEDGLLFCPLGHMENQADPETVSWGSLDAFRHSTCKDDEPAPF